MANTKSTNGRNTESKTHPNPSVRLVGHYLTAVMIKTDYRFKVNYPTPCLKECIIDILNP